MTVNTKPEIHNLVICSNVFIRKDGKYLVIRRSPKKKLAPNIVSPVGGKVLLGENPYQAAVREAFEETGLKIKNIKLEACILEIHILENTHENWLIFHFSSDYASGEIKNSDEGELLLLTGEEFRQCELWPTMSRIVDHIFNPHDGTVFASIKLDQNNQVLSQDINICQT